MAEYRINDLADASGVSVRNIRVYQDRGLLPSPIIRGRTGWYSDEHLVRLNLISRMLERGYTFATISELLHAAHYGMKVEQVLRGTPKGGRLRNFRRAATITITELRKTLNASERTIALSQKLGLLAKDGAHYAINSPEVLEGAETLVKAGVDIDLLLEHWVQVEADLDHVAKSFVAIITDKYFDENLPDIGEAKMSKIAGLIQTVRPMAHEIVESTFRKALDAQISKAIGQASTYFDAAKTAELEQLEQLRSEGDPQGPAPLPDAEADRLMSEFGVSDAERPSETAVDAGRQESGTSRDVTDSGPPARTEGEAT